MQLLSWSVNDPDSGEHEFWVEYSAEDGSPGSWAGVGTWITDPAIAIDFDQLSGSVTQSRLRVLASDGVNTGTATSASFFVPKKEPMAEIVFPDDLSAFDPGQLVWLQGTSYDYDDGMLEGTALSWNSDLDGPLGSGTELRLTDLSEGYHEITLEASDSDGNRDSDAILIFIPEPSWPAQLIVGAGWLVMLGRSRRSSSRSAWQ